MSFFSKVKKNLKKTREKFSGRLKKTILRHRRIDDGMLEELEEILVEGDLGMEMASRLIDALKLRVKNEKPKTPEGIIECLKEEMKLVLNPVTTEGITADGIEGETTVEDGSKPKVVMVIGVNGVGKTTTIGKLAYRYTGDGKKVMIAAADTFRAAAVEQLAIWADRAGAPLVRSHEGSDPASVAFDAVSSAMAKDMDLLFIDTAGRLHTKVNLMEELKKIKRVIGKSMPGAPHEILLVLDATTGQNGINQAKVFNEALGVTGVALTKLDGTARGGFIFRVKEELGVPVEMVGVGEGPEDLQDFDPSVYVDAIFD